VEISKANSALTLPEEEAPGAWVLPYRSRGSSSHKISSAALAYSESADPVSADTNHSPFLRGRKSHIPVDRIVDPTV